MAQPTLYRTVPCHAVLVMPYRLMLGYIELTALATSLAGGGVTGGGRAAPGVSSCASGKAPMGQHGHFSAAGKSGWLAPHYSYLCCFLLSLWWLSMPSLDFPLPNFSILDSNGKLVVEIKGVWIFPAQIAAKKESQVSFTKVHTF